MDPKEKLSKDINRFLAIYKILGAEARAAFAAQMDAVIKNTDEKTRRLYLALLDSAKDSCDLEDTIDNMNRAAAGKAYK
jgi:hypothetical protein